MIDESTVADWFMIPSYLKGFNFLPFVFHNHISAFFAEMNISPEWYGEFYFRILHRVTFGASDLSDFIIVWLCFIHENIILFKEPSL